MSKYKVVKCENPEIYRTLIEDAYRDSEANCPELFEKYCYKAPCSVEDLIEHTVSTLLEEVNFTLYTIWENDYLVAYFGRSVLARNVSYLTTFYIFHAYRNKDFVESFWSILDSKFAPDLYSCQWQNNIPAIDFLKRNGFKFYSEMRVKDQAVVVLKK